MNDYVNYFESIDPPEELMKRLRELKKPVKKPFPVARAAGIAAALAVVLGLGAALSPGGDGELIKRELRTGVSYAAARERALRGILGEDAALLRSPNNILAVEYLKAMALRGSGLRPIALPRAGAAHDGGTSEGVASASHIRGLLREGGDPSPFLPAAAA